MSQKTMVEIKCSECGKTATVPFKPTAGRPVYCKSCYAKRRSKQRSESKATKKFDMNNAWAIRGDDWQGPKEENYAFF
jgi:CxxC-x17-CxxC domain-containing protein